MISGKPLFSLPANIPVTFELTVLFAALTRVRSACSSLNGLPQLSPPALPQRALPAGHRRPLLHLRSRRRIRSFDAARTRALLASLGGTRRRRGAGGLTDAALAGLRPAWSWSSLSLVPLALIARARVATSAQPRIHLVPDMDNQPQVQAPGSATRCSPTAARCGRRCDGTVARGELRRRRTIYRGIAGDGWVDDVPGAGDDGACSRGGRERFDIFCAPCHGLAGAGDGMVAQRADAAAGGHLDAAVLAPHRPGPRRGPTGHLFNTITNGIRNMPAYGPQIPVEDRWAIVAYVRALQRSQNATRRRRAARAARRSCAEGRASMHDTARRSSRETADLGELGARYAVIAWRRGRRRRPRSALGGSLALGRRAAASSASSTPTWSASRSS